MLWPALRIEIRLTGGEPTARQHVDPRKKLPLAVPPNLRDECDDREQPIRRVMGFPTLLLSPA
jgi:hypothetical protein